MNPNFIFQIIIFLLLSTSLNYAQTFNTKSSLCNTCEKEISINFESTSFFKNNEYNNEFTKGFTGIGYFVKPTLQYYLTESTKVNAGIFLQQYAGLEQFSKVLPVFSVQQHLAKNLDLVFGNLYGTLNHGLEEPLFRFDRYYQDNVEYGLQFLYDSQIIEGDVWLNWENYIFKNDPQQEEFQVGAVLNFDVFEKNNFKINIPLQLLMYHKGGQIDTSPEPILSIFNGASGVNISYPFNSNELSFESLLFWYSGLSIPGSGVNAQPFKNGTAVYFKLNHQIKNFNYGLGYWNANKFIAPKGEYLFSSISENSNTFTEAKRSLITAKAAYTYAISKSVKVEVRVDGYYDTINKRFDFSNGLYLLLNEDFFIKKLNIKKAISN